MDARCLNRKEAAGGYVYFVRCGDFVKIGYADKSRFMGRMYDFKCGNPYPLKIVASFVGTKANEARFHELFDEYHHRGDWFRCEGLLNAFVEAELEHHRKTYHRPDFDGVAV